MYIYSFTLDSDVDLIIESDILYSTSEFKNWTIS